jgi:hypothetical protein
LSLSDWRFTQRGLPEPWQMFSAGIQVRAQTPAPLQISPVGQATPHAPQLVESFWRFAQYRPSPFWQGRYGCVQALCPLAGGMQRSSRQTWVEVQAGLQPVSLQKPSTQLSPVSQAALDWQAGGSWGTQVWLEQLCPTGQGGSQLWSEQ